MAGTYRFDNRGLPRRRRLPEEDEENGQGDGLDLDVVLAEVPAEDRRPGPYDCPLCGEPMKEGPGGSLLCKECDG